MKRVVVITVGKTHSGKTTFAKNLERQLHNSVVIDRDNQAEFINRIIKHCYRKGPTPSREMAGRDVSAWNGTHHNSLMTSSHLWTN